MLICIHFRLKNVSKNVLLLINAICMGKLLTSLH